MNYQVHKDRKNDFFRVLVKKKGDVFPTILNKSNLRHILTGKVIFMPTSINIEFPRSLRIQKWIFMSVMLTKNALSCSISAINELPHKGWVAESEILCDFEH